MPGMEATPEMFDLRMSEKNRPLYDAVKQFMEEEINPLTPEFMRMGEEREERGLGGGEIVLAPARVAMPQSAR